MLIQTTAALTALSGFNLIGMMQRIRLSASRAVAGPKVGAIVILTVTGVAPSKAAGVRAAIRFGAGTAFNTAYVGLIKWSLQQPAPITNFLFEAVQSASGISAATEPTWPTTLGLESHRWYSDMASYWHIHYRLGSNSHHVIRHFNALISDDSWFGG